MNKFITAILAILYLSTSIGAPIHMHYCMGKLISWGLVDQEGKTCGSCGMPKKVSNRQCITNKDCCKDEHKLLKSDKDQKITQAEDYILNFCRDGLAFNYGSLPDLLISSFSVEYPSAHAPPLLGKVPIFLLNCNFRI